MTLAEKILELNKKGYEVSFRTTLNINNPGGLIVRLKDFGDPLPNIKQVEIDEERLVNTNIPKELAIIIALEELERSFDYE